MQVSDEGDTSEGRRDNTRGAHAQPSNDHDDCIILPRYVITYMLDIRIKPTNLRINSTTTRLSQSRKYLIISKLK